MKVIQVPFCFYPDPVGGTEVYVTSLSRHLLRKGVEVIVAAPGKQASAYLSEGLPVRRFTVSQNLALHDLYGQGDAEAACGFGRILDEERPNLVHLHAFSPAVSTRLLMQIKQRRLPVVFTYHTPAVGCQRGTLMRWGKEVCDGVMDIHRCAGCTLHGLGLGKASSSMFGNLPVRTGTALRKLGYSGGLWTALRMTELIQVRHSSFHALLEESSHLVALSGWTCELLRRNGARPEKMTISRHGLSSELSVDDQQEAAFSASGTPLRIAFLGRLDRTKGPDILVRALRALPDASIALHLYGIVQGGGGAAYLEELKAWAAEDARISFRHPVPNHEVIPLLREYHLLAVPSRCVETGPLVVLEAFAAGTAVIGSNLGGIGELVQHEVNGLLVEVDSVVAWRNALQKLYEDREQLARLRSRVTPPRTMDDVADEMQALYDRLI